LVVGRGVRLDWSTTIGGWMLIVLLRDRLDSGIAYS
jgi:hypothetical protein